MLVILPASAGQAASTATICVVGGSCYASLQEAINAATAGDTIQIGAGVDTEAGIAVNKSLTIRGQGSGPSVIQAATAPRAASTRVLTVTGGTTVALEDLTIRYGFVGSGGGGGILNQGDLTLRRVAVSENGTRDGADDPNCSSDFCFPRDGTDGGGIYNGGNLTVLSSTVNGNFTGKGGDLTRTSACNSDDCDGTGGSGGDGGGIKNDTNHRLTMSDSTLSGNSTGRGGTCNGPSCSGSGDPGLGGGLYAVLQFSELNNVTITGNRSDGGGGINHDGRSSGSYVHLTNTIVVGNQTLGGQPSDCVTSGGVGIVSQGYNLVGSGTGCPSDGTGDLTTTTPANVLNPTLASNGGPTFTHALVAASAAINAGNPAAPGSVDAACALLDQRGFARPDRCDIGAYEFGGASPNRPPTATGDGYTLDEDQTLAVSVIGGVLHNDSDPDNDALTAVLVSNPSHAQSFQLNADGSFTYTPVANYNGTDSFTYKARDPSGAESSTVTVSLTINPVNDRPFGTPDTYSVDEDGTLNPPGPGVLTNDGDVDGDPIHAGLVSGPSHAASFTLFPNGSFLYIPAANYNGPDSFRYEAEDNKIASSGPIIVSITVNPVNDAPTGTNDGYSTDEDTTLAVPAPGLLGNDHDVDGDTLALQFAHFAVACGLVHDQRRRLVLVHAGGELPRARLLHLPGERRARRSLGSGDGLDHGQLGERRADRDGEQLHDGRGHGAERGRAGCARQRRRRRWRCADGGAGGRPVARGVVHAEPERLVQLPPAANYNGPRFVHLQGA